MYREALFEEKALLFEAQKVCTMADKSQVRIDLSLLECPICHDITRDAIFMCGFSHNICADCHLKLTSPKSCPSCRLPFDVQPQKNLALMKMIDSLAHFEFRCKFGSQWGCDVRAIRKEIEAHEQACPFEPFRCPLGSCREMVATRFFSVHCSLDEHRADVVLNDADSDFVGFDQSVKAGGLPDPGNLLWLWKGVPFLLSCKRVGRTEWADEMCYVWVVMAGHLPEASKYSCEIALANKHIFPVYKYAGPVLAIDTVDTGSSNAYFVPHGLPITRDVVARYMTVPGWIRVTIQLKVKE